MKLPCSILSTEFPLFFRKYSDYIKLPKWKEFLQQNPKFLQLLFRKSDNTYDGTSEEILEPQESQMIVENKLCKDLENLFVSQKYTDVVLEAEGKEIRAHKGIICSRSAVFDSMFSHDLLESQENTVKIVDTEFEILQELIRYIYCDRVEDLEKVALQLYTAADKYEIEDLQRICKDFLMKNLNADIVVEVLVLADCHSSDDLRECAEKYLIKYVNMLHLIYLSLH